MSTTQFQPYADSSVWLQSMVNGLAGISIRAKHSVYCVSSPFQKIEVYDTYSYGRILMLAGMIVLTERDEFIYNEMITHPAMLMHPNPRRVCIIGGGDGGALREALKYPALNAVTVVEIDAAVIKATESYFPSLHRGFSDPRTRIDINDGLSFLENANEVFDVILVDAYDPGGPIQSLLSDRFYRLVHSHLGPEGIAVFQTDSPTVNPQCLRTTVMNISGLFAEHKPYICGLPSFPEGICSFCLAGKSTGRLGTLDEQGYAAIAKSCRYYNRDVHAGAFLLPQYIRIAVS
jgi:spermidine synthase